LDAIVMKARRACRLLRPGTLGLLLVFAITAYAGTQVVAFVQLENRVDAARAAATDGQRQSVASLLGPVFEWIHTPGLATRANNLRLGIVYTADRVDIVGVSHALVDLAEAAPTSAGTWEAFAEMRSGRGDDMDIVLAAFRMSALTGSHEGKIMKRRALFGLTHWAELPERDRNTVVRDLLATARLADYGRAEDYRVVIGLKSQNERDEIRAGLMGSGFADEDLLQALGL
jgi:hypothetical protein